MKESEEARILLVDDEERNIKLMKAILNSEGYRFEEAKDGVEALEKAAEFSPSLILLDIVMPELDGIEVCKRLKRNPSTQHIPIILVTFLEDRETKIKGLAVGANDFITKPVDSTELFVRTRNLLKVKEYGDLLEQYNEKLKSDIDKQTEKLREAMKKLAESQERIRHGYLDTIHRLTIVAEFKDQHTATHIKRVGHLCKLFAEKMGLPEDFQEIIFYASPMHDIGKVAIPADILLKSGGLTPEEYGLMKKHTDIGASILRGSDSEFLKMAESIALTHHENWDGSGYTQGLKGEEIPIEGRIMRIVDQYDALRSERSYNKPIDHAEACRIITEGDKKTKPQHFDPGLLLLLSEVEGQLKQTYDAIR